MGDADSGYGSERGTSPHLARTIGALSATSFTGWSTLEWCFGSRRAYHLTYRINHNVGSVNNHEVPAIIAGHLLAVGRKRQQLKAAPLRFHHKVPGSEVTDSPLGMGVERTNGAVRSLYS